MTILLHQVYVCRDGKFSMTSFGYAAITIEVAQKSVFFTFNKSILCIIFLHSLRRFVAMVFSHDSWDPGQQTEVLGRGGGRVQKIWFTPTYVKEFKAAPHVIAVV